MTEANLPPRDDGPQPPPQQMVQAACSVTISCPPLPGGSKVMLPNFVAQGTYSGQYNEMKLVFELTKDADKYTAPEIAVLPPGGSWSQNGWTKHPLGGPPPNGSGYKLRVILAARNQFTDPWFECSSAEVTNITIDDVNGRSCDQP